MICSRWLIWEDAPRWWSTVMTSWRWAEIHEQRWAVVQKSWWDEQRRWTALICQRSLVGYMNLLYYKSKLDLLLRLGYLKPFLAGSKKTRQGPGCRVGPLCISRCWFYLTVVAEPKQIQKYYKIIWCCVLLCYGSLWMKWLCYVNDEVKDVYEMIMVE